MLKKNKFMCKKSNYYVIIRVINCGDIMQKIKIKTIVVSNNQINEQLCDGFLNDSIINYNEKDGTCVYVDIKRHEMIRENANLFMKLKFDKNQETYGQITLKDLNRGMILGIKTKSIEKSPKKICIEYIIEDNDRFRYNLSWEEEV